MNFQDPFKPLNVLLFSVERPKAVTNTQSRGRGGWRTAGWGRVHPARPPRHSKGSAREELREPHSAGRGGAPERGRLGAGPRRLGLGLAAARRALELRAALGCRAGRRRYGRAGPGPPRWLCRGEPGGCAPVGGEERLAAPLTLLRRVPWPRGSGGMAGQLQAVTVGPGGVGEKTIAALECAPRCF